MGVKRNYSVVSSARKVICLKAYTENDFVFPPCLALLIYTATGKLIQDSMSYDGYQEQDS